MFGSSMGKMTIDQRGKGWVVCEDGKRVGGTLLYPFESREDAQDWLDEELAAEAEMMAKGDVGRSARARVMRDTDPEIWAKFVEIEHLFDNDDARAVAHDAAGTWDVVVDMALAALEAEGILRRTGKVIDGRPKFAFATDKN
jgi:hypothetical protein